MRIVFLFAVLFMLVGCNDGPTTQETPFFTLSPISNVLPTSTPLSAAIPSPPSGLEPILLTPPTRSDQSPAWSPDGKQILFASYFDDMLVDIFSMDLSGNVVRHLVHYEGSIDGGLSWSPLGDRIGFRSEAYVSEQNETEIIYTYFSGIYLIPVGETNIAPFSGDMPPLSLTVANAPLYVWDYSWSPDGKMLAVSGRSAREFGSRQIYLYIFDGDELIQLTNEEADHWEVDWSPDGTRLVFTQGEAPTDRQVYVMNIDGSGKRRVSRVAGDYAAPSWSPDGRYIVVVSNIVDSGWPDCEHKCLRDLYLMDLEGRTSRLTFAPALYWDPSWSPDGNWIVFNSRQNDHDGIYILDMSWLVQ